MLYAYDTTAGLRAAVALVNSAEEPDALTTVDDLAAFVREEEYTGRIDTDEAELGQVRAIRAPLRAMLTAERDDAVALVNATLAEQQALPRLERHGDTDWHLHAVSDDAPLAGRVLVETALALVDLIRADDLDRLGVCADESCHRLVLDLTRNRSRRYCSTTCSNRNAVAAYRRRQRA